MNHFVVQHGNGDLGANAKTDEGRTLRRLAQKHEHLYVVSFGKLTIPRFVYGNGEEQKIELAQLDKPFGSTEGEFCYIV